MKKNITSKQIALNAIIASLYVVLTLPFGLLSTNNVIQIRPAEALAILPSLLPCTTFGITIGCMISNVTSAFGIADVVLGGLVTFVAAFITSKIKKPYLATLPPILLNAIFMPLIWYLTMGEVGYFVNAFGLLISQTVVLFGLGVPLHYIFKKRILPLLNQKI